jgi:hypothetical protein
MCNDYERELAASVAIRYMEEWKYTPPFEWTNGQIPNDLSDQPHIRIRDKGLIFRLHEGKLVGSMTQWGWKSVRGAPVFNFISEALPTATAA